ncbi:MAG TPA: tetratricopeptide repeat protein [Chthoniobacteraceae bacterium]|jgi:tetratricopeptide (TPR) repeat protein|nr:tetratricopeptide repeat protein [Chthoniobacteraceae bacterium]
MASASNDPDPDPVEDQEEDFIDAGFDPILFWNQYGRVILIAAAVIVLAAIAFGVYEYNRSQRIQAAGAALAQAVSNDDYQQVIDKYEGTVAAGDASLVLASKLRDAKKYDDAIQVLETFLEKNPKHPLAAAGDLSVAETMDIAGRKDDAISRYEEVAAKYPDSFAAPLAVLAQANLLRHEGKTEDARRLFENFSSQFPDSIFAQEAMTELRLMRPATGPSAAPTPVGGLENLSSPTPTPLPAAATKGMNVPLAASPAPVAIPPAAASAAPSVAPAAPAPVSAAPPAMSATPAAKPSVPAASPAGH